jgi:hypothetical protein
VSLGQNQSPVGRLAVSFAHPKTRIPLRVAATVVRVEDAPDDSGSMRIGLSFEQLLASLAYESVAASEVPDPLSIPGPSSSFSDSLGFVLEDGLCGGARVVSISSAGLRLNSGFLPANDARIKLLLEVDGVPFEVAGRVKTAREDSEDCDGSFGVELRVLEGSRTWDLYLLLLERAEETPTVRMPAVVGA